MGTLVKLVISCMAAGKLPVEYAGWVLREWSGKQPPGGGHPGWSDYAAGLRDRSTGRILPRLLSQWGYDPQSIVVVMGFSAGSNSGLRELLRNADDRAQIVGAIGIDGAHWNQKKPGTVDPAEYWDWPGEAGPFGAMAVLAAQTGKPFVCTASEVARPGTQLSMTREGLQAVANDVTARTGIARTSPAPSPFDGALTGTVKGKEITRAPVLSWAQGGFVAALYGGNQPIDHIWQCDVAGPAALSYLYRQGLG